MYLIWSSLFSLWQAISHPMLFTFNVASSSILLAQSRTRLRFVPRGPRFGSRDPSPQLAGTDGFDFSRSLAAPGWGEQATENGLQLWSAGPPSITTSRTDRFENNKWSLIKSMYRIIRDAFCSPTHADLTIPGSVDPDLTIDHVDRGWWEDLAPEKLQTPPKLSKARLRWRRCSQKEREREREPVPTKNPKPLGGV